LDLGLPKKIMKRKLITTTIFLVLSTSALTVLSQTLTLVTGQKLYDHHSSSLSNSFYGNYNVNSQSGYDFVNGVNVPSGVAAQASDRDMVEHNGFFGHTGSAWGRNFGFTSATTNIGNWGYQGNDLTKFYLNPSVTFTALNTVANLVAAYNSSLATKMDTAVAVGNVYIAKVRATDMYLAMRITTVSNLTSTQIAALYNQQNVTADVFFEFEYKFGTVSKVGINNLSADETKAIKIYPNPTSALLSVSSPIDYNGYVITTIFGETIKTETGRNFSRESSLDVSTLKPGIYFIEFRNNTGFIQSTRFVKE
jgi:hypothetical protein